MADQSGELFQNVIESILSSSGDTSNALRNMLAQQPMQLYGLAAPQETSLPPEMRTYVTKVATNAYKVTDRDIEQLRANGYNEDAIFEITLSVAAGAGRMCLQQGLAAMKGAKNALKED